MKPGPKAREVIERDRGVVSPSMTRPYPLVVERGEGSQIFDVDGNRYIDFASSVAVKNIGYNNPEWKQAVLEQMEKITHCGFADFYAEPPVLLCEKLVELTGYEKVFLSNSGAECAEAAIKLAMWYTHRQGLVSFYQAFHGRTLGALTLTCSKVRHREHYPQLNTAYAHYGYCYRCHFNLEYPECGVACVWDIEETIFKRQLSPEDTAAVFVEPIQGEGGYIVPPPSFHQELRKLCDNHNLLLVIDEVQTGGYRTGTFLAQEQYGVRGDIICLAKSLGGGLPLAATLSNNRIMSWPPGAHANTFGGNLLASAGGLATLNYLEKNRLGEAAKAKGEYLLKRLRELQEKHPLIGDVRGLGLMIGVELVKENKKPALKETEKLAEAAFQMGLVLLPAGDSTIRIAPPLIITQREIDEALEILEKALKKTGN